MAITVLPPVPLTQAERGDIAALTSLLLTLGTLLNSESAIPSADRTLSTDAETSINHTIIDASDRIDAIINPDPLP